MNALIFSALLFQAGFCMAPQLLTVRELYQKAAVDESACKELMKILENDKSALFSGYYAVSKMIMAQHAFNPLSKLSYFNSGRQLLDESIKREPFNTELRFLRFSAQSNAPVFLNYRSELNADKNEILKNLIHLKDKALKNMIVSFMKDSAFLSTAEKEKLK